MKKKILFVPLLGMLLAGCSFEDLMFWQKKDEESKEKQQENPGKTDDGGKEEETTGSVTKTVNFYGSYLPSEWKAQGVGMNCELDSCSTQNSKLRNCTSGQVGDASLLSELFFTCLNTAPYDDNSLVIAIGTGDPTGNKYKSGTFVWTSSKKIVKVDVTAQCYYKGVGATDSNAHLTIEAGGKGTDVTENNNYQRPITDGTTTDMSLAVESGETPTYKTFSNEYENGINRFCLTSLDGRVFLKSLTITWNS